MNLRNLTIVGLLAVAVIAAFVWATRYTEQVGASLQESASSSGRMGRPAAAAQGGITTVQFARNPHAVPDFVAADLDGRPVSTARLRGKAVIVNFWATWCPPCREEIPDFIKLQQKYRDRLVIVGVSVDEKPAEEVKRFAAALGMNYPVVMASPELRSKFPGIYGLPTSFIVDPEGRIVQKHIGLMSPALYEEEVRVLLKLPTAVQVEQVEDTGQVFLANAANATEIPGVDLSKLTANQRTAALQTLNAEKCTCGCELTLAQCRINDPTCTVSLPLANETVKKIAGL